MDIPQTYMEPILLSNAAKRGADTLLNTEYISHTQDDTGVTTILKDRLSGEEFSVRSEYLIGADGARSKVAEDIGLPME
ncbi:FAD-dependent monooxygenase, partial [Acidithiobacillus sp. MC6.1]|nr:FAD-dependent monooxygenase [Acidithiobacillus sp. MC6.1]